MTDTIHELSRYAQDHGEPYSSWADDFDRRREECEALRTRVVQLEHALIAIRDATAGLDVMVYEMALGALEVTDD